MGRRRRDASGLQPVASGGSGRRRDGVVRRRQEQASYNQLRQAGWAENVSLNSSPSLLLSAPLLTQKLLSPPHLLLSLYLMLALHCMLPHMCSLRAHVRNRNRRPQGWTGGTGFLLLSFFLKGRRWRLGR